MGVFGNDEPRVVYWQISKRNQCVLNLIGIVDE